MSYFVKHTEDMVMPLWLKNSLSTECDICGAPMLNYYNDDMRCTNRRCSNRICPGMLAARFTTMCELLGVKGVGYKTGLRLIRQYNLTSHVDCIKYVMDEVLTIKLGTFLRCMQFEGVDKEWETICNKWDYYDLDTLYKDYDGELRGILDRNKEEIYRCSQFFIFSQPKFQKVVDRPITELTVMITGTPKGYASKEAFVNFWNEKLLGVIKIYHCLHARKTGVDILIREKGSTTKTKYAAALEAGIPIVTSEEFIQLLTNIIEQEMKKGKEG